MRSFWFALLLRSSWAWGAAVALLALQGCASVSQIISPSGAVSAAPLPSATEEAATRRSRVRLELASAYFGRAQYATALQEVRLSIASDPKLVEAYNLQGLILSAQGEDAQAEASFRQGLALAPRDADTLHNLGWFFCQRKRYAEADAQFDQALSVPQYRDVPRTLLAKGVCQSRSGRLDLAERSLTRAFELDASNPVAGLNLSEVLFKQGALDRARFYMRRVNAVPGASNAQTLWLAARIEHRLGNRQSRDELGNQLRDRFPRSAEAAAFDKGVFDE